MTPSAVGIVVPARNEEAGIEPCLESLDRAAAVIARWGIATFVVVAGDSCTDRTVELAARWLRDWGARGRGARRDSEAGRCSTSTPATSVPPAKRGWPACSAATPRSRPGACGWRRPTPTPWSPDQWLARQVRLAGAGWDAVAGVVAVDAWVGDHPDGLCSFEEAYGRRVHRLEHGHVHAANLGLRASAYLAAGGFRPRRCGEDHDLWSRLDHPRLRRLSDPDLHVTTSGRLSGRAADGFSRDLADLDARQG